MGLVDGKWCAPGVGASLAAAMMMQNAASPRGSVWSDDSVVLPSHRPLAWPQSCTHSSGGSYLKVSFFAVSAGPTDSPLRAVRAKGKQTPLSHERLSCNRVSSLGCVLFCACPCRIWRKCGRTSPKCCSLTIRRLSLPFAQVRDVRVEVWPGVGAVATGMRCGCCCCCLQVPCRSRWQPQFVPKSCRCMHALLLSLFALPSLVRCPVHLRPLHTSQRMRSPSPVGRTTPRTPNCWTFCRCAPRCRIALSTRTRVAGHRPSVSRPECSCFRLWTSATCLIDRVCACVVSIVVQFLELLQHVKDVRSVLALRDKDATARMEHQGQTSHGR